ncbi:MAG TPA: glycosyltransferase family 1 protein, partial [Acidimicrobiales bacterium]
RFRVPGPYLVYPAVTHPHKNHITLLHALVKLRKHRPDLRLVCAGGRGNAHEEVLASIDALGLNDSVVVPGRVSPADRDSLVAHADVLVFPSVFEGFGAPVLEAMYLGTPVVAAAATALPEVVGDAGVLVPPTDANAYVEAVEALLADPTRGNALREAGRRRASWFTADRSASVLVDAFTMALK